MTDPHKLKVSDKKYKKSISAKTDNFFMSGPKNNVGELS